MHVTKNTKYLLGFLGLISGGATSLLFSVQDLEKPGFGSAVTFFIPGILFGFFLALYPLFSSFSIKNIAKALVIFTVSVLAWWAAFSSFFVASAFGAGVIGAAIILIGVHFLFAKIPLKRFLFTVALGGILGSGMLIPPISFGGFKEVMLLFLIWQTGMMIGIGWALEQVTANQAAASNPVAPTTPQPVVSSQSSKNKTTAVVVAVASFFVTSKVVEFGLLLLLLKFFANESQSNLSDIYFLIPKLLGWIIGALVAFLLYKKISKR